MLAHLGAAEQLLSDALPALLANKLGRGRLEGSRSFSEAAGSICHPEALHLICQRHLRTCRQLVLNSY